MTILTDDQWFELAQEFASMESALGDFRLHALKNGAELTDPNIVQLHVLMGKLNDYASQLAQKSAIVTLEDMAGSVNQIRSATTKADAVLESLARIDKGIAIGAAAVALGAAIFAKDPSAVAKSAEALWNVASADDKKENKAGTKKKPLSGDTVTNKSA